jgi:uncharacterized protein
MWKLLQTVRCLGLVGPLLLATGSRAADEGDLLPAPTTYVTDPIGLLSKEERGAMERRLRALEAETTAQVIVYIAQRLPPGAKLEPYATRCFNRWGIGQAGKDNGVVLFVFSTDHLLRIEVGRGLERALSNATCKAILDTRIVPEFRRDRFGAGISSALDEIIARIRSEAKEAARPQGS